MGLVLRRWIFVVHCRERKRKRKRKEGLEREDGDGSDDEK